MVRQDHMSRLCAADIEAAFLHPVEHMAVADLGALEPQPLALQKAFEAEVRHHRRDDAAALKPSLPGPARADQPHDLVAVDDRPLFVDDAQTGGDAIDREPDTGAARGDTSWQ